MCQSAHKQWISASGVCHDHEEKGMISLKFNWLLGSCWCTGSVYRDSRRRCRLSSLFVHLRDDKIIALSGCQITDFDGKELNYAYVNFGLMKHAGDKKVMMAIYSR